MQRSNTIDTFAEIIAKEVDEPFNKVHDIMNFVYRLTTEKMKDPKINSVELSGFCSFFTSPFRILNQIEHSINFLDSRKDIDEDDSDNRHKLDQLFERFNDVRNKETQGVYPIHLQRLEELEGRYRGYKEHRSTRVWQFTPRETGDNHTEEIDL